MGKLTAVLEQAPLASKGASPEVVTLENLRSISRGRSLGLGIATVVLAVIEIVIFGFRTDSSLQSTIVFASNTATSIPTLSSTMRIVVAIIGALCVAGGVVLLVRRKLKAVAVLLLVVGALLLGWVAALLANLNGSDGMLKTLTVPVAGTAFLFGAITVTGGVLLIIFRYSKAAFPIFFTAVALFLLSFLIWVSRGSNVGTVPALELTGILGLAFISATPLIYGSLSGVLCERSGVVNIAVEGMFMLGAMGGAMVASVIGHTTLGLVSGTIAAAVLGGLLGTVLAYMALHFRADQIIVGVVIVAFCTGLTQFMMSQVLDSKQWLNKGYGAFPLAIPGLSKIPFFGPILFDQTYFVYLAVILVALANYGLFRTRWGLRVRSVGEKPRASETVGLNVLRIKYRTVILGGVIAGIGGAVFTIGQGIPFEYGITNGEGFIALAIMIFGRWRPWGALSATMLFGFTIAIGSQLNLYSSQLGVPTELISALPYIITIAAVAGLVGRIRPPAADGIPYSRE